MANHVDELTRAGDLDGLCAAIDHYVHDRSERLPIPEGKIDLQKPGQKSAFVN